MITVNKNKYSWLIVCALVTLVTTFVGCKKDAAEPYEDKGVVFFKGNADFSQMTPVPATASTGTAIFTGRYDNTSHVFNYSVAWKNMASPVTKAEFFFPSDAVQNGLLTRTIFSTTSPRPVSDTIQTALYGNYGLSDKELADLQAGKIYYTISTSANPTGEIRGQISIK